MAQFSRSLLTASFSALTLGAPFAADAQTREEITRKPVTSLPDGAAQTISVNDGIERAPCPLAAPEFAELTLTLTGAEFRNLFRPEWCFWVQTQGGGAPRGPTGCSALIGKN